MPLFSKKNDDSSDEERRRRDDDPDSPEQAPPDEHTRLLPNRLDSTRGLLAPDDPAVTPYNLWTIRTLRFFTVSFALVSFLWWVLLLVSAFTTPPGFHTRGSGFYAFGYASLALANMLFTLIFFGVPAKPVRIVTIVIAVSLSLDIAFSSLYGRQRRQMLIMMSCRSSCSST